MKIAYIGDQPEKTWKSPITRKVYEFRKKGGAKCPMVEVEDERDVAKLLSHSNTFDQYERVLGDNEYFVKLEKRRKAKKAALEKERRAADDAEKIAAVGEVENICNEILQPYINAISNLEDIVKALRSDVDSLKAGAIAPKK
jgi:hypothetical protein